MYAAGRPPAFKGEMDLIHKSELGCSIPKIYDWFNIPDESKNFLRIDLKHLFKNINKKPFFINYQIRQPDSFVSIMIFAINLGFKYKGFA